MYHQHEYSYYIRVTLLLLVRSAYAGCLDGTQYAKGQYAIGKTPVKSYAYVLHLKGFSSHNIRHK